MVLCRARTIWQQAISRACWPVQTRVGLESCIFASARVAKAGHISPGLGTPSSRTTPTHRYVRLCTAHMLCRAFPAPPGLSGAPALVCLVQTCCLQLLTCFACMQVVCSVGASAANALPEVCPPSGDPDREASSQLVLSAAVRVLVPNLSASVPTQ